MKFSLTHKTVCVFLLVLMSAGANAQTNDASLFNSYKALPASLTAYVQKAEMAVFDKSKAASLIAAQPAKLNFTFRFEDRDWTIELSKSEIFSKGFYVSTGSKPNEKFDYNSKQAIHYRGKIAGLPHSFAAVSILADRMIAVIADEKGNINIGAVNNDATGSIGDHIIYRENDLLVKKNFECSTDETQPANESPVPVYTPLSPTATTINAEPIDIYFEADYLTYYNNSSSTANVVNYVLALFNVVHTLYVADSINTKVSGIKVWDIADPYVNLTSTATVLNAFSINMSNGFPGDIAHFISQRGLGGGRAFLDVLCSSNSSKTGVSGNMSNYFNPVPTYSWSTMVITHETGHNLGSQHTQYCGWPGGAIDNCYATEGGCAQGPAPINGGTMMSYCHLTSYGINFANGFGPLPGQYIRNRVRNNSCINPSVYFETTYQTVAEENAAVENGCFDYTLLTTKLSIPYAPSQPVNVTLVPTGSGGLTAGTNKDVEISPLSFTLDSTTLSKTISFKVYNDALIENTDTLLLNFTINANGGNAIKRSTSYSHTLIITDSDHRPDSNSNVLLFYEPFDSIAKGLGNWRQTIVYGINSPNRWVIRNSGDPSFYTPGAYISNDSVSYSYAGTTAADSCVVRLESPVINAAGFSNMHVYYQYKCVGEYSWVIGGGTGQGETLVGKDYGKLLYSTNNGITWLLLKDNITGRYGLWQEEIAIPAAANNAANLRIAFEWHNNSSVVSNPPLQIDSIVIRGTSTTPIQTAAHVSNIYNAYLGPYQTVHYYNPVTKNIMASIENSSSFDFGCTEVQLIRTGNDANAAWDTAAGAKITNKAFKITAENNNPNAPYKLTLYYSSEEINGWVAATHNQAADLQIVKTSGNILTSPIASPALFSSVNTVNNYGAAAHKTFTASFTGFSSFALGKRFGYDKCPVSTIVFTAGIAGTGYQWQINTGGVYTNISNNIFYSGATSDTLRLTSVPTSYYGYQYRCVVTTSLGLVYSTSNTLKFGMTWLGTQNKLWEDPLNWGCGLLPDANTDVIIKGGTNYNPEINGNTSVRSLRMSQGANVMVRSGAVLTIKH